MEQSKSKTMKPAVNFVHSQIIHRENIIKEKKYEGKNFKQDYTFSPHTCNNKVKA